MPMHITGLELPMECQWYDSAIDGGAFASKPYAAGGRYIDKMSNYCQSCAFKPTEKLANTHAHLITFIGHFWFSTALGFPIIQEWQ